MNGQTTSESTSRVYRDILHRKMLVYGFTVSIISLPIGLLLKIPVVWGLAIAGIIVGGLKLWTRKNQHQRASSNKASEDVGAGEPNPQR